MAAKSRQTDWQILKRIAMEARPYWPHFAGLLFITLLATPVALLAPVPLKIVIDTAFGAQPLPGFLAWLPAPLQSPQGVALVVAPGLLIATILLAYLQGSGGWMLQTYAGERLALDFRARIFARVQRLPLSYHDRRGPADATYRIQFDAAAVASIVTSGILPLLSAATRLACMLWITALLDPAIALVCSAAAPVLLVIVFLFRTRLRENWTGVRELESASNSVVQEVLSSLRVVKVFCQEDREHARYVGSARLRVRQLLRTALLQGGFDILIGLVIGVTAASVLAVGVRHVQAGLLSLGSLALVTAYSMQLLDPLKAVTKHFADLQSGLASGERAFALLDERPDVIERKNALPLSRARGNIRFENVSFGYDPDRPILQNLNLDVPAGARIGLRGSTGSGKSTLIGLLTRLQDVDYGRILLDGVDIRDYKLADARNQFAVVLQEPLLFSASIAENIAYGKPGAPFSEILRAAKMANAHDFITLLADGYDTVLGERGADLSGGQRQRISLARAFLKDAPILILDEPTSALDNETQDTVMSAVTRLMRGRTTFIIAHRLSTLADCDVVFEVNQGQLRRGDALRMRA